MLDEDEAARTEAPAPSSRPFRPQYIMLLPHEIGGNIGRWTWVETK
jgi:hypothetical protein